MILGMDTLDTALEVSPRDVAFLQDGADGPGLYAMKYELTEAGQALVVVAVTGAEIAVAAVAAKVAVAATIAGAVKAASSSRT